MSERKVVMVTGASQRLGLFLCQQFVANDCIVVALTRKPSEALLALASSSEQLHVMTTGSYKEAAIQSLLNQLHQRIPKLDVLVHNSSRFEKDNSLEGFGEMFHIHMRLPAQLNVGLEALLCNNDVPGNIIHITDIFAENPSAEHALYCSTKAGLESLSKSFAKKFAPNIRVNTIQPGPIQFLPSHSEQDKKRVLSETLLNHEGGFMPVFQAVMAIIENPYITGSSIKVDGGRSLGRR